MSSTRHIVSAPVKRYRGFVLDRLAIFGLLSEIKVPPMTGRRYRRWPFAHFFAAYILSDSLLLLK